ncbi:MAG: mannonate dehydratase [Terracidiphilus sp.]|jgi:mannonate dehydratase
MEQTWRWFGPKDKVSLSDARQAGAEGIVTALHHVPIGEPWSMEDIQDRQQMIQAAGMRWSVVESLDVSERIKLRADGWQDDVAAFSESLRNLAACGITTVAYNLMPVFSWMRTHLEVQLPHGGFTTRYDSTAFAAFDLYMLRRNKAEADWPEERRSAAYELFKSLSISDAAALQATILQGLPGGNGSFTLDDVREGLDRYREVDTGGFRTNAGEFLKAVCPLAQELGIRLCIHPDDPPWPLLGLPRIVSTENDLAYLLEQSPEDSNGITFCTGALGSRPDNDLIRMVRRFGHRIWFAHLRSTELDAESESFTEALHLEGDTDVVGVLIELAKIERQRRASSHSASLPFRADHGQQLLNDIDRKAQAGYPAIGRLRGLAELRGALRAIERLTAN